ncbi:permease [Afifella sp. H1R]|nr:permease [Afifella sp. H1R]
MTVLGIIAAFGGGIFGAAIGALPAFEMVGFLVMIGVAVQLGVAPEATDFFGLPFGVFGPHVGGFASGVAAAAYAARRGKFDSGKNILAGMMGLKAPDVLLVGGAFGIFGYIVQYYLALVPAFGEGLAWTDTVALTVVISAIVTRLMFGKAGLFGTPKEGTTRWNPGEADRWLPFQSTLGQLVVIGLGVGIFGGYLGDLYGGAGCFLAFGISAASLIFLQFGVSVPVTHHIALPAALAAAGSGSLLWAAVVGVIGALLGEFFARLFHDHGDTHFDPPATTIATMTLTVNYLLSIGFFSLVPLPY